jgi:RNA polymerase sigma-70 factor (ECF subfamily)
VTLSLRFLWFVLPPSRPADDLPAASRPAQVAGIDDARLAEDGSDPDTIPLARMRDGDMAAFEALYRKFVPRLCTFAGSYVKDRDVAEEVVQDVMCTMWERRTDVARSGTLRAYLFASVRYRVLDHVRNTKTRLAIMDGAGDDLPGPASFPAPSTPVEVAELAAHLSRAIMKLPRTRRRVLLLRWEDGLSYAEIAQVVGSSVKAVENQLNRTLKQLREALGPLAL